MFGRIIFIVYSFQRCSKSSRGVKKGLYYCSNNNLIAPHRHSTVLQDSCRTVIKKTPSPVIVGSLHSFSSLNLLFFLLLLCSPSDHHLHNKLKQIHIPSKQEKKPITASTVTYYAWPMALSDFFNCLRSRRHSYIYRYGMARAPCTSVRKKGERLIACACQYSALQSLIQNNTCCNLHPDAGAKCFFLKRRQNCQPID